jgi:hypothetical protein
MLCEKCKHIICLQAFSYGKCKVCGNEVVTPHIPCYSICKSCSDTYNLCEQCGINMNEGEPSHGK